MTSRTMSMYISSVSSSHTAATKGSPGFHTLSDGNSRTHRPFTWMTIVFTGVQMRIAPSCSSRRYASQTARGDPSGCRFSARISRYIRLYFGHKGREREQYAGVPEQESRRVVRAGRGGAPNSPGSREGELAVALAGVTPVSRV